MDLKMKRVIAINFIVLLFAPVLGSIPTTTAATGDLIWSTRFNDSYPADFALAGKYAYQVVEDASTRDYYLVILDSGTGEILSTIDLPYTVYDIEVDKKAIYLAGADADGESTIWKIDSKTWDLLWSTSFFSGYERTGISEMVSYRGNLYVAGSTLVSGSGYRDYEGIILKLNSADGSILWTVEDDPTAGTDVITDVAVDKYGVYLSGRYDLSPTGVYPDGGWRVQKRNPDTGEEIWTIEENPTIMHHDSASGITLDKTGIYVAGYINFRADVIVTGGQWRITKLTEDGTKIWDTIYDPLPGDDIAHDLAVYRNELYVVGNEELNTKAGDDLSTLPYPVDSGWLIIKMDPASGDIIDELSYNPSIYRAAADWVAVDNKGFYVSGWSDPSESTRDTLTMKWSR